MKIGAISDTHNYFDPQISRLFNGVEHILHGGDIGAPAILVELERIAPVTAVSGNTDEPGFGYPETQVIEIAGLKFLVHHIVSPQNLSEPLVARISRDRPDVVVFGHTHKPYAQYYERRLFFNPGYAGKTRFGMERTLAILNCEAKGISWQYYKL